MNRLFRKLLISNRTYDILTQKDLEQLIRQGIDIYAVAGSNAETEDDILNGILNTRSLNEIESIEEIGMYEGKDFVTIKGMEVYNSDKIFSINLKGDT